MVQFACLLDFTPPSGTVQAASQVGGYMTKERFSECLLHIRWTPINLASALQCDLSWVEALEAGNIEVPAGLAAWLETLAQCHEAAGVPTTYRGWGHE
jgi:hypothetical protein